MRNSVFDGAQAAKEQANCIMASFRGAVFLNCSFSPKQDYGMQTFRELYLETWISAEQTYNRCQVQRSGC